MKLQITAEHIKNGVRYDTESCPIALALKEQGYKDIQVGHWTVHEQRGWARPAILKLSGEATRFVMNFDTGSSEVEPCTLELFEINKET